MPSKANYVRYSACSELCFCLALHPTTVTDIFCRFLSLTAQGEGT